MSFDEHLRALVCFHLEEHTSAQHLLQIPEEDDFAREVIAPKDGIKKSGFSEATNSRGLERFLYVFQNLQKQAAGILPDSYPELGELVAIDGSLIDSVLSMDWADCRKGAEKAEVHVGSDLNRTIPRKVFLTDGKGAERPFVSQILTGVMDHATSLLTSGKRKKNTSYAVSRPKQQKRLLKNLMSTRTALFFSMPSSRSALLQSTRLEMKFDLSVIKLTELIIRSPPTDSTSPRNKSH